MPGGHNFIDLQGKRFGRLIVAERSGKTGHHVRWRCLCDCGATCFTTSQRLRIGKTKSCGCFREERRGDACITHGLSGTRLFRVWTNMKTRCFNPRSAMWNNYGGRGITVCGEWAASFEAFASWAMAFGYADDLSIERIDVDKNYTPDNCTWIHVSEQAKNRRVGRLPDRRRISDVAAQHGLKIQTVRERIRRGWDPAAACTLPHKSRRPEQEPARHSQAPAV